MLLAVEGRRDEFGGYFAYVFDLIFVFCCFTLLDLCVQLNIPFFPRRRMNVYGHHDLLMKAEFLFFWVPTFIIWSLTSKSFEFLSFSSFSLHFQPSFPHLYALPFRVYRQLCTHTPQQPSVLFISF